MRHSSDRGAEEGHNVNWANPYEGATGRWLKGNLHTHTREGSGCGRMSLSDALARYTSLKYDFLCISDHMTLTPARHRSLVLLPGLEWNSPGGDHMGLYTLQPALLRPCLKTPDPIQVLRHMTSRPAVVVLNHANWQEPSHYSREQLMERKPVTGMEIYNGVIEELSGAALSTDKWDYLLSRGRRLLGFASDDAHDLHQIGQAWIMVRAATRTPNAIIEAIRRGRFYASTGVTIRQITRTVTHIIVDTTNADEIWAVGQEGVRLARVAGRRMEFDTTDAKTPYVRFTVYGRGSAMAWTQPFFLETTAKEGSTSPFVTHWRMSRLEPQRLSQAPAVGLNSAMGWKPIRAPGNSGSYVDLHPHLGDQDGVVYLANRFAVTETADWVLSLGHDGGARLLVDGKLVAEQTLRTNPAITDRTQAVVRLTRGTHEIMVILDTDHGRGQGIMFRFIQAGGSARHAGRAPVFPKRLA